MEDHFAHRFDGRGALLARAVVRSLARIAQLDRIDAFLREHAHLHGLAFVEAALAHLDCRYQVDHVERERIPEHGRVVIAANHPMGGLDALALLACIGSIRRDVRVLGNDVLRWLGGLGELLIPIPVFDGRASGAQLSAVRRALEDDCAVIVFPAGEVSRLDWRGVRDGPWRPGFVRFAQSAGAPILPVRIGGRNSALFYGASAVYKPLGTSLLPRELFARRGTRITIRIADPCPVQSLPGEGRNRRAVSLAVRRAIDTLHQAHPDWRAPAAIAHRRYASAVRTEIEALPLIGSTADGKRIHAGRLAADSALLREIARLREQSFRQAGEGTGRPLDTDSYDTWYDHIVLWDTKAEAIAGAYRAVAGAQLLAERGLAGLYSAKLFAFAPELEDMVAQGVELGRSFVAPAYRGGRSLEYLWYGIGAWLRQHPGVRYLFGPVSISAAIPREAREWMVGYYSRYFGEPPGLASAPHPFRYAGQPPRFDTLDAEAAMQVLREQLERLGTRVPTLYKQYVELCEPGGVGFLAFGVDPDFSGAIDGLIRVDLTRMKPRKRERYLGVTAATAH
ncbi:lysophospholipid acyltransferase family protein [Verticiella sediminum]|nr:GNAT family N-acyltransferase [Verticiella sediminum]